MIIHVILSTANVLIETLLDKNTIFNGKSGRCWNSKNIPPQPLQPKLFIHNITLLHKSKLNSAKQSLATSNFKQSIEFAAFHQIQPFQ